MATCIRTYNCEDYEIEEVVERRRVMFNQMQTDMELHPHNVRKHKATEACTRCYQRPGSTGAGHKGCEEAMRLVRAYNRDKDYA